LDKINPNYAFIPGWDKCCGDLYYFSGELEQADRATIALVEKMESYDCPKVVFGCPTCHCRFGAIIAEATDLPFEIQSFAQFVAENIRSLSLKALPSKTVTLHEACKSAFTGLDLTGPRDILNAIPGIDLKEMERHGKNAVCSGSGAVCFFPESFRTKLEDRLGEASGTDTDILVDVCHFCH
jgi:Fe-S oxidoreductase